MATNVEELLEECVPVFKWLIKAYGMPEDTFQNGMVRAWKSANTYNPDKGLALKNWMILNFKSAIATDAKRYAHKESLDCPIDSFERVLVYENNTETNVDISYLMKRFCSSSTQLEQEVAFLMLEGMTLKQIVSTLSLPSKRVDNAIQKVRKKMKICLEKEGWQTLSKERVSRIQSPARKPHSVSVYPIHSKEEEKAEKLKIQKEKANEFWARMKEEAKHLK